MKFVTLKQIAAALEMSEDSVRRCAKKLGLNQARDKVFRNRYIADRVKKALKANGYEIEI